MGIFSDSIPFAIIAAMMTLVMAIPLILLPVAREAITDRAMQKVNAFEEISALSQQEKNALRRHLNPVHVRRAQALGLSNIRSRDDAERLSVQGRLVQLESNPYFHVQNMRYSIPFVTPGKAQLLNTIGERFHAALDEVGLPPYQFIITSGLRTRADQTRLARVNRNAARGRSSHEFGTTVDIVYTRFRAGEVNVEVPWYLSPFSGYMNESLQRHYQTMGSQHYAQLKAILGRILLELQAEGAALVIFERQQPVYHVTLGRDLPTPVAAASG